MSTTTVAPDDVPVVLTEEPDGIYPIGRRRRAYSALALAGILSVIDGTVANVALPTIGHDLHASPATTVWVTNGFQLAVTAMLFTAAAVGSASGLTRIYRYGVIAFAIGSLLCAISSTMPLLIAARIAQGAGAAFIMALSPALLRVVFPRAQMGQAFGINAMFVGAAAAAGPLLGGALLSVLSWPWLFAISVPLAVASILLGRGAFPEMRGTGAKLDVPSMITSAVGFTMLVYGLDGVARHENPISIAIEIGGGAAVFAWFAQRQFQLPQPMIALDLFRLRLFRLAAGTSVGAWLAAGTSIIALPFLFQLEYGFSPFVTGLLMTSWPIATATVAPFAGRLADKYGAGIIATIGLTTYSIGLAAYAIMSNHASVPIIVAIGAVCGAGFGTFQSPNNRELMGSGPIEKTGSAAALLATIRVGSQTLGASVVAIVFAAFEAHVTEGRSSTEFLHAAVPIALGFGCLTAAISAVVSARRNFKKVPVA